jgi:N-acetylneuraminate synthase
MHRASDRRTPHTRIIAEAGVNHNGSLDLALQLVAVAARAGADVVKFQTFRSGSLVAKSAPKAEYQKRTTGTEESQLAMLQRLELSLEAHHTLVAACARRGIEFLSSPFDAESLRFLSDELSVSTLKLGSGELTNAPLLIDAARTGLPLILSTGMATMADIEDALGVLAWAYRGGVEPPSRAAFRGAYLDPAARRLVLEKVTLLHCTSEYPAAFAEVNLRAMATIGAAFDVRVGLSDHTPGISVAIGAAVLGATVIEKHFTLDKDMDGPDHQASLSPDELTALVRGVREVEAALGRSVKVPSAGEIATASVARKSVVAAREIAAGAVFTREDLCTKRPGTGRSPLDLFDLIGRRAQRAYAADEVIDE